jgi:hypothetical protein
VATCRHLEFDSAKIHKRLPKRGRELAVTIGYNVVRKAMMLEYVSKEVLGTVNSSVFGLGWNEMYAARKAIHPCRD